MFVSSLKYIRDCFSHGLDVVARRVLVHAPKRLGIEIQETSDKNIRPYFRFGMWGDVRNHIRRWAAPMQKDEPKEGHHVIADEYNMPPLPIRHSLDVESSYWHGGTRIEDLSFDVILEPSFRQASDADKMALTLAMLRTIVRDPLRHNLREINHLAELLAGAGFIRTYQASGFFGRLASLVIEAQVHGSDETPYPSNALHPRHLAMLQQALDLWNRSYGADLEGRDAFEWESFGVIKT